MRLCSVYGVFYAFFARQKIRCALFIVLMGGACLPVHAAALNDAQLYRVETQAISAQQTQVRVLLGQCVVPKILVLPQPYRVVLDFAGIVHAPKLQSIATGDVQRVRFSPFSSTVGRLVLHTAQENRVEDSQLLPQANGQCVWQANLYAKSAVVNAPQGNIPAQHTPQSVKKTLPPPVVQPNQCTIVLDAGHGGSDPGAMAARLREKHITLYAAKELKRLLQQLEPNINAVLTREKDVYIPLPQRPALAQKHRAHMFVSLHADMLPNDSTIRGASVYTLSNTASDPISAALALSENKVDSVVNLPDDEAVAKILLDLVQRETQLKSQELAQQVTTALRSTNMVVNHTHREAGFRVLRGLAVPSILIELGYLSNAHDRAILNSKQQIARLLLPIAQTLARQCPTF